MKIMRSIGWSAAVALATTTLAHAGALTVVEVAAPAVNCVFRTNCILPVTDSSSPIPLNFSAGAPFLQSRTFTGTAGAPGAALTGYEYRVDMRTAAGAVECQLGLVVDFGPIVKLPYKGGSNADVYVVTQGGLGTVKIKSAEQDGSVVTFAFSKPMCVGINPGQGESTFFFGMASAKPPHAVDAGMWGYGTPAFISLPARAPNH